MGRSKATDEASAAATSGTAPVPWRPMFYRALGALGRFLIVSGIVVLLFVGFQLWGTGIEHSAHQDDLGRSFSKQVLGRKAKPAGDSEQAEDAVIADLSHVDPTTAPPTPPAREGDPVGIIEIPKIGVRQFIVEGTAKDDLKKGPGHYTGTPLPGQAGNASIAGHRTTYGAPFNRIDELQPGDVIDTYTPQGRFTYQVMAPRPGIGIEEGAGWFSVLPTQTEVIAPTTDNRLTLTACHPKRSARQRIVVQAELVAQPAPAPTTTTVAPTSQPQRDATTRALVDAADSFGGDAAAKWPAIALGAGFAAVWILAGVLARRWRRWPVVLVAAPALTVLLWWCFVFTDRWLPSI
jgi:sortase A